MGYRKAYYRKDGTYVSDSFDNRRSRKSKPNNKGCVVLILIAATAFGTLAFFGL